MAADRSADVASGDAFRRRHRVPDQFCVYGHAIVSADDFIAGTDGLTPPELRNEADWSRFQAMLDSSVVTVLGRLGHEANPNVARRRRLVLTGRVRTLEQDQDGWYWNPDGISLGAALRHILPTDAYGKGGIIAVPGGRRVFDFFLCVGYDEFHLARAEQLRIEDGTQLFSSLRESRSADDVLHQANMQPVVREALDPAAGVSLTVWRSSAKI